MAIQNVQKYIGSNAVNRANFNSNIDIENNNFTDLDTRIEDISLYEEATYAELKTLKDNSQLKTGQKYLLTDYVTKYQQPESNKLKVGKYDLDTTTQEQTQEETEPLLLTAISENEFATECYSPMFPDDIIYYNFDDNLCEDGTTQRNGFILRRYFVKNEIDMPNDWRKIKWARYEKDYGAAGTLLTYDSGGTYKGEYYTLDFNGIEGSYLCFNIVIDGAMQSVTKSLCNTVWSFDTEGRRPYLTTFGSGCYSNTFGSNCHYNTFGSSCRYNTFGSDCDSNTFGSSCYSNTFGSSCRYNTFGSDCYSNTFGSNCYSNTFGSSCRYNTFGFNCYSNTFGSSCRYNTFGSSCDSNTFGSSCRYNTFGSSCYSNTFGSSCDSNTFGSSCRYNTFGSDCDSNTFGSSCRYMFVKYLFGKDVSNILELQNKSYTNTIEQMSNGSYCYWYKTGTNSTDIVTVQIP